MRYTQDAPRSARRHQSGEMFNPFRREWLDLSVTAKHGFATAHKVLVSKGSGQSNSEIISVEAQTTLIKIDGDCLVLVK